LSSLLPVSTPEAQLRENLAMNCIPESILSAEVGDYEQFLKDRRRLMAKKIEAYYNSL
jgi:hypothetical protein